MGRMCLSSLKGSSKSSAHERKSTMTPTQRESVPAKSPVLGGDSVASHSPFDPHHRPVVSGEVYRAHLSPHLDPTLAYHRVLDPGTVLKSCIVMTLFNENTPCIGNIKWSPSYWCHQLQSLSLHLLLIFCFSPLFFFFSAIAFMFPRQPSPTGYHNTYQLYTMENTRQTILNDYITSQQMQVIPRPDMARGLSPREQPVTIPYAPGARGMAFRQLNPLRLRQGRGGGWEGAVLCRLCACVVVATFSRHPEANDLDKFCWFALYTGAATDSAASQFLNDLRSFTFSFAEWLPFTSWPLFHSICSPIWKHWLM